MNDNEDKWLDALAGREKGGSTGKDYGEAKMLREYLVGADADESDHGRDDKVLRNILESPEARELIGAQQSAKVVRFPRAFKGPVPLALAASVLTVAVSLKMFYPSPVQYPDVSENFFDYPVTRGGGVQDVVVEDPAAATQDLKARLYEAGVAYRVTDEEGDPVFELYLEPPVDDEKQAILNDFGISGDDIAGGWFVLRLVR